MLGLDFFVWLCFYVDGPEDAAAVQPDPCRLPPCRRPPPTATSKHWPGFDASLVGPGRLFDNQAAALCGARLRPQFDEAGRGEVAVESERLLDALGAHEGEAGRIDKRVLALVVLAEPAQRLVLDPDWHKVNSYVARVSSQGVEKFDSFPVPSLSPKPGPSLTSDVVRRDHLPPPDLAGKPPGLLVVWITGVEPRNEK